MTASDGVAALELLRGKSDQTVPWPYVILPDLSMPRMNVIEFLKEIRNDSKLADTVIFVLTTSDDDRDMIAAYREHAAGYIVKTSAGQNFVHLVAMFENFSLTVRFHDKVI